VSDAKGELIIPKLPQGDLTFVFYHERFMTKAIRNGVAIDLPRGRLNLEIKAGQNDLGDFAIPPAQFKR